jgi:hypothetical protein
MSGIEPVGYPANNTNNDTKKPFIEKRLPHFSQQVNANHTAKTHRPKYSQQSFFSLLQVNKHHWQHYNSIRKPHFHPGVEQCDRTCLAGKAINTPAGNPA